jgi:hypothetical protein
MDKRMEMTALSIRFQCLVPCPCGDSWRGLGVARTKVAKSKRRFGQPRAGTARFYTWQRIVVIDNRRSQKMR